MLKQQRKVYGSCYVLWKKCGYINMQEYYTFYTHTNLILKRILVADSNASDTDSTITTNLKSAVIDKKKL